MLSKPISNKQSLDLTELKQMHVIGKTFPNPMMDRCGMSAFQVEEYCFFIQYIWQTFLLIQALKGKGLCENTSQ